MSEQVPCGWGGGVYEYRWEMDEGVQKYLVGLGVVQVQYFGWGWCTVTIWGGFTRPVPVGDVRVPGGVYEYLVVEYSCTSIF